MSIPVDHVPLVATAPLQPPEAVQPVTFCAFQLNMAVPLVVSVLGDALKVTEGAEEETTTSADCAPEPPGPVQVNVKLVVAVNGRVVALPLTGFEPLHPPEAMQLCASVAFHCSVVALPIATSLLAGTSVTAGIAALGPTGTVDVVSPDAEKPQAASAENAAHDNAKRNARNVFNARSGSRPGRD